MKDILSENHLLSLVDKHFARSHPNLILSRGGDCAEFFCALPLATSTDLFIDNFHFRRRYFLPAEIGYRALAVNLSDLAAAGAQTLAFSVAFMCPPDLSLQEADELLEGMASLAAQADIPVSGGDISSASELGLNITVWGKAQKRSDYAKILQDEKLLALMKAKNLLSPKELPEFAPFLRRGAEAGDVLLVISPKNYASIGLARVGFLAMEQKGRKALEDYPVASRYFLRPVPLLKSGRLLSALNAILSPGRGTAYLHSMDISDGLFEDLPRLLKGTNINYLKELDKDFTAEQNSSSKNNNNEDAELGAKLELKAEDLHTEVLRYVAEQNSSREEQRLEQIQEAAVSFAFSGGEDFSLLVAAAPEVVEMLEYLMPKEGFHVLKLGLVDKSGQISLNNNNLKSFKNLSFDHFKKTQ